METRAVWPGNLEIRAGGRLLSGSFPYSRGRGDRMATVSDRGTQRKERIAEGAFDWQITKFQKLQQELAQVMQGAVDEARAAVLRQELERRNVHVLAGHDFDKPLGDMLRGTARVKSTRQAVEFEVDLPEPDRQPTYMSDTVKQIDGRLTGGISPGFTVPPRSVVGTAERLEPEAPGSDIMVRVVEQAVLYELSIVTRPAYSDTALALRAEELEQPRRRRVWL